MHPSSEPTPSTGNRPRPLVVDLDGTLVLGDTLHESLLGLLHAAPVNALLLPAWLLRGKAGFKRALAARHRVDPGTLAYNQPLLEWIRSQREERQVVLCTAADAAIAQAVAAHLGLFDAVIASNGQDNLSAGRKADALVARYGERGFDYVGNDAADLPVWQRAHSAILCNATTSVSRAALAHGNVVHEIAPRTGTSIAWLRALRLHQWAKNLLLFVPLLTAHLVFEPAALAKATLAFVTFCLCASGVYLLNDLADLAADRRHPRKRLRPFAAGQLSALAGSGVALALLASAFALAIATLPLAFVVALAAYFLLTCAYSLRLKRVEILDVVVLAALYTARIIAGALALQVELSFWLLAFSMFLFLSLALLKRHTELGAVAELGEAHVSGRGYRVSDLPLVAMLGVTAGYASVLVFALYINSPASAALYARPTLLWLLCPLLLFWIGRVWLLSHRRRMHDDPLVFALTDPASLLVLVAALVTVGAAI
ncbi:UbiA family prenyltransferase [Pseudofulvimonas gallinarii]|jgi:4-hydroxybenzoate polyprenyltransferase/phosphoserine phosphatase|uniref:4-hydroxybenzoate polyprenyltransferase n=1 Tax=Pseudofulvimonas gallinarii TaxID=634155 RepID=A0A4R3LE25_9GAMM|nr:UbiA family prenyltransferase [Pseudofulvimonas gallinarii]TCS98219.1 4-hydroxybenzoate polyprenyltransferase [Pseudofulvimonas gallinarii]THD13805.1 hypothetical protein B1808_06060 [Pseudofulvimonas gallinarii]